MRPIARNGMLLLAVGLFANAGRGEDPAQPTENGLTVKVCGLQIIGAGYGKGDDEIRPLNSFESGTAVGVMVRAPKGWLIDFMDRESRVKTLSDDKGTDLLLGESRFSSPGFSMMPRFSKDGRVAMLEVHGPSVPVAGATTISLEGTATFLYSPGGKVESAKNESIDFAKDAKVKFGETTLVMTEVGKPSWGEEPLAITLETKGTNTAIIKQVIFMDAAGKVVESNRNQTSRSGSGADAVYSMTYHLKQKVEKGSVTVEYWPDAKKIEVPIALKVGVGQ